VKLPQGNIFGEFVIDPLSMIKELNKKWRNRKTIPTTLELFLFLDRLGKTTTKRQVRSKAVTVKGLKTPAKYSSFYAHSKRKKRAFMLDLIWWKEGVGTLLAAESELHDTLDGIKHDFEKLLCWKAPLKLMITTDRKYPHESVAEELSKYAHSTQRQFVKNECFVLFVYGRTENKAYISVANEDGARKFQFREVVLI
jgi:hypothetical protein